LKIGDQFNYKSMGSQLRFDSQKDKYVRRWLSLYEYEDVFGEKLPDECYQNDLRSKEKTCKWCGQTLEGRRYSFCSDTCSKRYGKVCVWERGMAALPYKIAVRDKFYCRVTGEDLAYYNGHGIRIPTSNRNIEIHHLILISQGGSDHESNLITISKEVHKLYHSGNLIVIELINKIIEEQYNEKMFVAVK